MLDNLSTGFREAVAPDATFVAGGHRATPRTVLTPDAGFDAVLHFAGLIAAGESMVKPELYWDHNVVALAGAARRGPRRPGAAVRLLLHRRGLRQPHRAADHRVRGQGADQHVRRHQARLRHGADLGDVRARAGRGLAALLQRGRRATSGRTAPRSASGTTRRPTSSRSPCRWPPASATSSSSSATTTRPPTAPASATTSTSRTWPGRTCWRWTRPTAGEHRIYNLGNGNGFTNRQVVDVAREVTGAELPVEIAPRREGDPATLVASSAQGPRRAGLGAAEGDPARHDRRRLGVLPQPRRVI